MEGFNLHLFDAIAWTIIHSLWQGALIFIATLTLFVVYKKWNASLKFNVSLLSMILLFLSCIATFAYEYIDYTEQNEGLPNKLIYYYTSITTIESREGIVSFINKNTFLISNFWMLGFLLLSFRYLISYAYLLAYSKRSPTLKLDQLGIDFSSIKEKIEVSKNVILKTCSKHMSPFTIGYIKPMVFFPFAMLNALDPAEIEAILAHELAHIKRNDYIINLLTSFIEVIMYYHPVIWWLQKQLDIHRENACDDMAINVVGDRLLYAKALVKLQENLQLNNSPEMALAFAGNHKSIFLNRIKRMFNMPYTQINIKEKLIASLVLFALALGITEVYAHKTNAKDLSLINTIKKSLTDAPSNSIVQDTLPPLKKKESITIIKSQGDKEVEVKMENGKVTYLNIDGKQIPESEYDQHRDLIDDIKPLKKMELRGLDGDFEGLKHFDIGDLGRGFSFSFGDDKDIDHELKRHHFNFNFDSLRENIMMGRDSMFPFFKNKNFNNDSLFKNFDSGQFKLVFPDGDGVMDLRDFPDKSFRIYRGDDMDDQSIHSFDDADDVIRLDRNYHGSDDIDFPRSKRGNNLESIIGKQLNRDGFLIVGKVNKVELSGKGLKINGEKQPSNIWNKYKALFEIETGLPLSKDTKLVFEIDGKDTNRRKRSF